MGSTWWITFESNCCRSVLALHRSWHECRTCFQQHSHTEKPKQSCLQVLAALEQDFHFTNLSGNKWGLAVYKPLRWGLAGAGNIAADFAEVLALVPGAQLAAVAVRSQDRLPQAQAFADKHGMLPTSALGLHGKSAHKGLQMHSWHTCASYNRSFTFAT